MSLFDNVSLNELSDADLQAVLDDSGKGKAPVYKRPIRELLELSDGKQGTVAVPYAAINPAAKDRTTVILGMRAAIKKIDEAKDRLIVRANPDDSLVTVYFRAA